MLSLASARTAILRELDGVVAGLGSAGPADWSRPVRCEGWTVIDLARHATLAPRASAEGLRRMEAGIADAAPMPAEPDPDPGAILAVLRPAREDLARALAGVSEASFERVLPLPVAVLPGALGLQLVVTEIAMHRNDLEWALGNPEPLAPDVCDAVASFAAPALPVLANRSPVKPAAPLGYRLTGDSVSITLHYSDGAWRPGEDGSIPVCEVAGDDSSVLLFAFGRVPFDRPGLKVSGADTLAPGFKTFVPGP